MQEQKHDVVYCVTAIVDLLGFSSHLEVGGGDIRTTIGQQAISRLQTLVDSLGYLQKERTACPEAYPPRFHYIRFNDALVLTFDLPRFLVPTIGESVRSGHSVAKLEEFFSIARYETAEQFEKAYRIRGVQETTDLRKFVGLVARLHSFINRRETEAFFPGAKTIVASGYRKGFFTDGMEDAFSANFAFSNAYLAESHLHGPRLFLDNSITQMLCIDRYARNIMRFASFTRCLTGFDPMKESKDDFSCRSTTRKSDEIKVSLLRRPFIFREFDPAPLTYLQLVDRLRTHLMDEKDSVAKSVWHSQVNAIRHGPKLSEGAEGQPKSLPLSFVQADIENDIRVITELLETGESKTWKSSTMDTLKASMLGMKYN